jgi:glycosyltransferase involved in cell wall biosynthesis
MAEPLMVLGESVSRPNQPGPEISIIVPVRNEEACIGTCLESLNAQSGVSFEILVIDDGSSDNTRAIATSIAGVTVHDAGALPDGWCGKPNACLTGAKLAKGKWLLFTDADTVHAPAALASALNEAGEHNVAMLSYSPGQDTGTVIEKAVMPLIFAELANCYRTQEINNAQCAAAAANGQYILIEREAYWSVGGHEAVAHEILEDVALARLVKAAGLGLRFRHEGSLVRTRMYRSLAQLVEGWSKNLLYLFPSARTLAARRMAEFSGITGSAVVLAGALWAHSDLWALGSGLLFFILYFNFLRRVGRAHFGLSSTLLSLLGLPIFSLLLLRSFIKHKLNGSVEWKGRRYTTAAATLAPAEKCERFAKKVNAT